jgi:hypothetical protein
MGKVILVGKPLGKVDLRKEDLRKGLTQDYMQWQALVLVKIALYILLT